MKICIKKINEHAQTPTQGSEKAAGYDLYACLPDGPVTIDPHHIENISTGICAAPEEDDVALCLFPRSGLAYKHGVTLINSIGLIDSDYRGEIKVPLINHGQFPVTIRDGDRIAQLVVLGITRADFQEVAELPSSERGAGGFGSTGI